MLETENIFDGVESLRHQNQQSDAANDDEFPDGAVNPAPSIHHAQGPQKLGKPLKIIITHGDCDYLIVIGGIDHGNSPMLSFFLAMSSPPVRRLVRVDHLCSTLVVGPLAVLVFSSKML